MKMISILAAIAVCTGFTMTIEVSAADEATPMDYLDYGFRDKDEMVRHFTITSIELKPVANTLSTDEVSLLLRETEPQSKFRGPLSVSDDPLDIQNWITIGEKIWNVIVNNRPIANVTTHRVSVLPKVQPEWNTMENWKGPSVSTYKITAKNGYGDAVISTVYTVAFNFGGQINSKGAFLANATVIPTKADVAWGFTLNSSVEVGEALNTATKDDPIPGIELQLKYSMDSVLKHSEGRASFFIRGNGEVLHFNNPN